MKITESLCTIAVFLFLSSCTNNSSNSKKILSRQDSIVILSQQYNTLAIQYGLQPYYLTDDKQEVLSPTELIRLIERIKKGYNSQKKILRASNLTVIPDDIDTNQVCYKYIYKPPLSKNTYVVDIVRTEDSAWLIWSIGVFDYECIIPDSAKTIWSHKRKMINLDDWKQVEKTINKSYLLDLRSTYNYQCFCGDYLSLEFAQRVGETSSMKYYSDKPRYKKVEIYCPNNTDINSACKYLAGLTGDSDFWFPIH